MTPYRTAAITACGALAVAAIVAGHSSLGGHNAGPAHISVSQPYIPLPPTPDLTAGYLTVHNTGGTADRLVGVSSPDAPDVSMHRSTATSMVPLASLAVPAHGTLNFARDGNHIMIMGLKRIPVVGQTVELDLTFAKSGTVTIRVPIKPLTYRPPQAGTSSGS